MADRTRTRKTLWCDFNIRDGIRCRRAARVEVTLDGGLLVMLACREHLHRMERVGRVTSHATLTSELKLQWLQSLGLAPLSPVPEAAAADEEDHQDNDQ